MKKIIYILIFMLFFLNYNQVYLDNTSYNNEIDIKKIELVENYIKNHNKKINLFIKKYKIKNNSVLNKNLEELNTILTIVQKLKTKHIEKKQSEDILKEVLVKIKDINEILKNIFKEQKNNFDTKFTQTKKYYHQLGITLSKQLDTINLKIAKNIFKNKITLSKKEKEIKKYLILLNIESNKLNNFGNIHFNSEDEIKETFTRILKNIKRDIKGIKNNI